MSKPDIFTLALAKKYADRKIGKLYSPNTPILPETTLSLVDEDDCIYSLSPSITFEVGKEYIVTVDGVQFRSIAKIKTEPLSGKSIIYLGNAFLVNESIFPDTGESYAIVTSVGEIINQSFVFLDSPKQEITVSVEAVGTINPSNLPGMTFHYIRIHTPLVMSPSEDGFEPIALTQEESAQLFALASESKIPFIHFSVVMGDQVLDCKAPAIVLESNGQVAQYSVVSGTDSFVNFTADWDAGFWVVQFIG